MTGKKEKRKKLSLLVAFPSLAKEWHPEKNDMFGPGDVFPNDFLHVWWKCHLKHEWIATIEDRVNGAGCPVCPSISRQSFNMISLAEDQPGALKYWHPEKNGGRTPDQFAKQSAIKVWWRCNKGHEWYATVTSMRYKPRCRICYPGPRTSRRNNLELKRPELARKWHPTKNGDLLPSELSPYSSKNVWWMCENGHEWQAKPASIKYKSPCPLCSPRGLHRFHNLAYDCPDLVPFWHPEKNGGLTPADLLPGSVEKVWWICEKGHEWERNINYMKKNQTCPECRRIQQDATWNLQAHNPELAAQWHPEKNGDLTPDKVRPHAMQNVWWLCPKGHEYRASPGNRNRAGGKGRGCPICSGRKDLSKENLAIRFPELAEEWHPEKNGDLSPEKVSTVNNRLVWWKCKNGHQWQASVNQRVHNKKKRTCPECGIFPISS